MTCAHIVSTFIMISVAICHYLCVKPPPIASAKEREVTRAKPLIIVGIPLFIMLRHINTLISPVVCSLFLFEAYGIYMTGTSQFSSIPSFLCPTQPTRFSPIYQPDGRLPTKHLFTYLAIIAGGLIRVACYNSFGASFRWELSIQPEHKLVTTGPYSIVRHPSYTGMIMVFLGWIAFAFSKQTFLKQCLIPVWGLWIEPIIWIAFAMRVGTIVWLPMRSVEEDKMLKTVFGEEWVKWSAKTRYRLVPFVL